MIAAAIHAHLGGTGLSVASRVGEHPNAWTLYRRDKRIPTESKIASWCAAARVVVTMRPDGTVEVTDAPIQSGVL